MIDETIFSLAKQHYHPGGLLPETLTRKVKVDWNLPDPLVAARAVRECARIQYDIIINQNYQIHFKL